MRTDFFFESVGERAHVGVVLNSLGACLRALGRTEELAAMLDTVTTRAAGAFFSSGMSSPASTKCPRWLTPIWSSKPCAV